MHDHAFWIAVRDAGYAPPVGFDAAALTPELLARLADPDPIWRDEIAVETLTHWILGGYYSADALRALMHGWLANLHVGIGEDGTNSVLVRSFSALMLSIIAFHDWQSPFLTRGELHHLLAAALAYLRDERDVRGYDEQMGWLHSPAHTADLLKFLARSPHVGAAELRQIAFAVADKVAAPRSLVWTHSEYERLGLFILDVAARALLTDADWAAWIERLKAVKWAEPTTPRANYHGMYQNTKHFLRAVYFILAYQQEDAPLPGAHDLHAQVFGALRLFRS